MERRKIQTVDGETYTVSLPEEWAEGEGIHRGTPQESSVERDERDTSDQRFDA